MSDSPAVEAARLPHEPRGPHHIGECVHCGRLGYTLRAADECPVRLRAVLTAQAERLAEVEVERERDARTDADCRRAYAAEIGIDDPEDSPACWDEIVDVAREARASVVALTAERDEAQAATMRLMETMERESVKELDALARVIRERDSALIRVAELEAQATADLRVIGDLVAKVAELGALLDQANREIVVNLGGKAGT